MRRHRVREVDFRRPNKFNREQVRRLEHAHDGFCQSASSRLSAELRSELQLSVVGTDPVVDEAVSKRVAIEAFLQQTVDDVSDAEMADAQLLALAGVVAATPVIDMDGPVVEPPPAPVGGESAIPPLHLSV